MYRSAYLEKFKVLGEDVKRRRLVEEREHGTLRPGTGRDPRVKAHTPRNTSRGSAGVLGEANTQINATFHVGFHENFRPSEPIDHIHTEGYPGREMAFKTTTNRRLWRHINLQRSFARRGHTAGRDQLSQ